MCRCCCSRWRCRCVAGLLFGLHSGFQVRRDRSWALAIARRRATLSQSRERHRARNMLVVVQVALALVLLIGSGLMIRTFERMRTGATRVHATGRSADAARFRFRETQVKEPERVLRHAGRDSGQKIAAIPGVDVGGDRDELPLDGRYTVQ